MSDKQQRVRYKAIVVGASAGGLNAVSVLLSNLPATFPIPFIIVQHRSRGEDALLEEILQLRARLTVKQADEKESVVPGTVYIAPPDYHVMIEMNETISLSSDEAVNYSRPSIDVLFRSAAEAYKKNLLGIVLTGANDDGANGIRAIRKNGGCTIAQAPDEAEYNTMPQAAIKTRMVDHVFTLKEIVTFLTSLSYKF
jgi:two-component system chemotaxis response regulator CheB